MSADFFEPLPWQAPQWQRVATAIDEDRLGHALLLAGPAGTGKRQFARRLAAALWCRRPAPDRAPCGDCEDCRQVASEAHSGYFLLRPEEDKRDISIDAIRKLGESLCLTTADGRAKVAILEPADALNVNGVNALLKTIEEPTPGSHLLLISERPLALAPTLRSRCQTLHFAVPAAVVARAWLASRAKAGEAVDDALAASRGAPLAARELLDGEQLAIQAQWRRVLIDIAAGQAEPLSMNGAIGDGQVPVFLRWLYAELAEALRQLAAGSDAPLAQALRRTAPPRQRALLDEIADASQRLARNVNAKLIVDSLAIGWAAAVARPGRA